MCVQFYYWVTDLAKKEEFILFSCNHDEMVRDGNLQHCAPLSNKNLQAHLLTHTPENQMKHTFTLVSCVSSLSLQGFLPSLTINCFLQQQAQWSMNECRGEREKEEKALVYPLPEKEEHGKSSRMYG